MAKLGDKCSSCPTLLTEDNCRKNKDKKKGKIYISHNCKTCYNASRGFKKRKARTHCKNEDCGVLLTEKNSHWTYYTTKDGEKKKSRHSDCIKCSNIYSNAYQKRVKARTRKPLKKIALGDKCKLCPVILTEENAVKHQRKGVLSIRGCCKTCENKKIQERNMKSGRVKTKRRKITHCKNEDCGVLLTDENNVVHDGRVKSLCRSCYNVNQRKRRAERFVSKCIICPQCNNKRRKSSMSGGICKYCVHDKEVAFKKKQRQADRRIISIVPRIAPRIVPKKRTKKLKKEIARKVLKETALKVVVKCTKKLSARDKISKQIEQNEKARKTVNISASEDMIEKFLEKNKVKKDVQPMSNKVEPYTGILESTHTYIGNKSLINFD